MHRYFHRPQRLGYACYDPNPEPWPAPASEPEPEFCPDCGEYGCPGDCSEARRNRANAEREYLDSCAICHSDDCDC